LASQPEIKQHYDSFGHLHALRLEGEQGGFPEYTCALFDGDFTKTHTQAQRDKHAWILDGIGVGQDLRGKRVLDIGCGWGPMLNAVQQRGGQAIGITLSPGQVAFCKKRGVDARLQDYKELPEGSLGRFDGIVALGSFEHFCSVKEMLAGEQEAVYRKFFKTCADRLAPGGGLYVQTMTWNDRKPDYEKTSLDAPRDSEEAILARLEYMYPGSYLPIGLGQIVDCASEYLEFVSTKNGRLDYIETLKRWAAASRNLWKPSALPRTLRYAIPIAFRMLFDQQTRIYYQAVRLSDNRVCFERQIMSHERMFFRRK
jgi:cyclopropane-fatty-acyl-phospholipid synthase